MDDELFETPKEAGNQLNATTGLGWFEWKGKKWWHLDMYFEDGSMYTVPVSELDAQALIEIGFEPFEG